MAYYHCRATVNAAKETKFSQNLVLSRLMKPSPVAAAVGFVEQDNIVCGAGLIPADKNDPIQFVPHLTAAASEIDAINYGCVIGYHRSTEKFTPVRVGLNS